MSEIVADTSEWIELLAGRPAPQLVQALTSGNVVLPPLVIAELVAGAETKSGATAIDSLVEQLPLLETDRFHWKRVGELRRFLRSKGVSISTPDSHVAQCALDRDAVLLARDAIFAKVAKHTALRLVSE